MTLQPWRLLLPHVSPQPSQLDQQLFDAILAFDRQRAANMVNLDNVSAWDVDQDRETLTLQFDDESAPVIARTQIIGTFNRSTFMWAWHNPSVNDEMQRDSQSFRELGRRQGWPLFEIPTFPATSRDGYAIMALAAQSLGASSGYAGTSGDTVVYFTLYDLQPTNPAESLHRPASDEPSFLEQFHSMIDAQVASVQLSLSDLRGVEALCEKGHAQVQAGEYLAAVQTLEKAWGQLGEYAGDQEPAGWIRLAKANALFLANRIADANVALTEAEQSHGCPDLALLYQRMGQCARAMNDDQRATDMFVRVFVAAGPEGMAELSDEDRRMVETALRMRRNEATQRVLTVAASAPGDDPQLQRAAAVVKCLVSALHKFEVEAHELSEAAGARRADSHILCDADLVAHDRINSNWCWLMATWCTPNRKPKCGSWGSPPEHDPNLEQISRVSRNSDGSIAVESFASTSWGNRKWRYELSETQGELLVNQIYSVWDDEEIPSI